MGERNRGKGVARGWGGAASVVLVVCLSMVGLPLSPVLAAPAGDESFVEEPVGVPPAMDPGQSSYEMTPAPVYQAHVVDTPEVVSTDVVASGSADAIVAGLPVSVQVVPEAGDNPEDVRPVVIGVDSLDAAATEDLGAEVFAFGVQPTNARVQSTLLVTVDYSDFRYALGGDWADRLELSVWPCSAAEADLDPEGCGQPVSVGHLSNDVGAGTL